MAHKTKVNGTNYEISGGKTKVNSTHYTIDKGKVLVGGTVYEIGFVPTIIEFTISGTKYQAEEGMTWNDWVNSEYSANTGIRINGSYVSTPYDGRIMTSSYKLVKSTDIIKATEYLREYD